MYDWVMRLIFTWYQCFEAQDTDRVTSSIVAILIHIERHFVELSLAIFCVML